MSIIESDTNALDRIMLRGELSSLSRFEMITALDELSQFCAKALADRFRGRHARMRQQELAHHVAELACTTVRDANIAIISGIDSGLLERDEATWEIQLRPKTTELK